MNKVLVGIMDVLQNKSVAKAVCWGLHVTWEEWQHNMYAWKSVCVNDSDKM